MESDQGIFSRLSRPDLQEFLSTLSGFLDKRADAAELSYLPFLDIFCRSIGASEGHFLQPVDDGVLLSRVAFGFKDDFNDEFNKARRLKPQDKSPCDEAFHQKQVMAVVDVKKEPRLPEWFVKILNRHGFVSLVAVPLIGPTQVAGVFCAYYHDVCLFDQHTRDQMKVIGRMMGAAAEKPTAAPPDVSLGEADLILDQLLETVAEKPFTKFQLFELIAQSAVDGLKLEGVVCGPVRKTGDTYAMTVAAGVRVPESWITTRVDLPPFLVKHMMKTEPEEPFPLMKRADGGVFKSLFHDDPVRLFACLWKWQKKIQGAIVGWRDPAMSLQGSEGLLLTRLSRLSALALNISTKS
ncbi:MAG: GAF domain-containing protein [Elusimicrobia bacterium]|nr:GAF domain-containing protein [Candidatus Obscuribacterium magneticum]